MSVTGMLPSEIKSAVPVTSITRAQSDRLDRNGTNALSHLIINVNMPTSGPSNLSRNLRFKPRVLHCNRRSETSFAVMQVTFTRITSAMIKHIPK